MPVILDLTIRNIAINGKNYNCKVKKSSRARRIRLQIKRETGLELIVPDKTDIKIAEHFLNDHLRWIEKHISKLENSGKFYFLGDEIDVEHQFDLFNAKPVIKLSKKRLIISSNDEKIDRKKIYEEWLIGNARKYLIHRANLLADRHGFRFNKIAVRRQSSRWGSCSSRGNLSFNYKLMRMRKKVIDYVIVHELCHLREMNHSKKFWKIVGDILPDYKSLRAELKK